MNALQYTGEASHAGAMAGSLMHNTSTTSQTICPVCYNLQPFRHRSPHSATSAWNTQSGRHQTLANITRRPYLCLSDISTRTLIQTRDINPATGRPFHDCRYCRLICEMLDQFFASEDMNWVTQTRLGMYQEVTIRVCEGFPLVVTYTGYITDNQEITQEHRAEFELSCSSPQDVLTVGVPCTGLPSPQVVGTPDRCSMDFFKRRIHECFNLHPGCQRLWPDFVPKRLLYLGDGLNRLRLCESPPTDAKWATLGHDWGDLGLLKLTSRNMEALKQNIDFIELPATFRNFILTCRALSIDWLWIDVLCIVQNCTSDGTENSVVMGKIFHEALVVYVSKPSTPRVPHLGAEDDDWSTKTLQFETPLGVQVPINVRKRYHSYASQDPGQLSPTLIAIGIWESLNGMGPVHVPGFAFEEPLRACRVLHLTPNAFYYTCKTHRVAYDFHTEYALSRLDTTDPIPDDIRWREMVEVYSIRLAYTPEKLSAIADTAMKMPQAPDNLFLAGLWRSTIFADLLWYARPCPGITSMTLTLPESEHRTPTWSWASLNCGVLWHHFESFVSIAEVQAAYCVVDDDDPFGATTTGVIKFNGRMTPCGIFHDEDEERHYAFYIHPNDPEPRAIWFASDGRLATRPHSVFASSTPLMQRYRREMGNVSQLRGSGFIAMLGHTGTHGFVGLVLTASERYGWGFFERLGVITNMDRGWYECGRQMNISLV